MPRNHPPTSDAPDTRNLEQLAERMDESMRVLMQHLGPKLLPHTQVSLTPGQVFLLHFIQNEFPCTVTRLADKMEVSPSAITVMLDRLENHGYVRRSRDQADRRTVLILLTPAGEEQLHRMLRARRQMVALFLRRLGLADARDLVHLLEKSAATLQTVDWTSEYEADPLVPSPQVTQTQQASPDDQARAAGRRHVNP